MAFRKLQFKNVQATRSTAVIGEGELAVDPTTMELYLGDGVTPGGILVSGGGGGSTPTLDQVAGQGATTSTQLVLNGGLQTDGDILPVNSNTKDIGSDTLRFHEGYFVNMVEVKTPLNDKGVLDAGSLILDSATAEALISLDGTTFKATDVQNWNAVYNSAINWTTVNSTYNASAFDGILADVSGGAFDVVLPATPNVNDTVTIRVVAGSITSHDITIDPGTNTVTGGTGVSAVLQGWGGYHTLIWTGTSYGWVWI